MEWSATAVLLSVGAALVTDQRSKTVALSTLAESPATRSGPRRAGLRIVRTPALLLPIGRSLAVALWIVMLAAVLTIADRAQAGSTVPIALGAALGGAAGNLFDLWRRHAVIDFIDLGWWPPFNVADVIIVGGTLTASVAWWAGVAGRP